MGFPAEQTQQRHDENTGGCVNKKIFKLQQEKKIYSKEYQRHMGNS